MFPAGAEQDDGQHNPHHRQGGAVDHHCQPRNQGGVCPLHPALPRDALVVAWSEGVVYYLEHNYEWGQFRFFQSSRKERLSNG